jgi:hypothetical protein
MKRDYIIVFLVGMIFGELPWAITFWIRWWIDRRDRP